MPQIILASASKARTNLLTGAGVEHIQQPAKIDERTFEVGLEQPQLNAFEMAIKLAEAKALSVSSKNTEAYIIGTDQTLSYMRGGEEKRFNKPETIEHAKQQLKILSEKSHMLHSACICVKQNKILFSHCESVTLTMRRLSKNYIDRYFEREGSETLTTVGCYKLEGQGANLFEKIEGDYFTTLGLPLLPLLAFLRSQNLIDG